MKKNKSRGGYYPPAIGKHILCLVTILSMLTAFMPSVSAKTDIQIGQYVQMGKYYGEPILWRCVDIDENGYLMLSDKVICIKAFDAQPSSNTDTGSHSRRNDKFNGSNYWADSNLRSWLNSTASAGNVQWLCGNPPNKDSQTYNAYDQEAGFLSNFTWTERNAIKEIRQKSLLSYHEAEANMATTGTELHKVNHNIADVVQNYNTAYAENVADKIFCMDVKQVNAVYNNGSILGENYYMGKPTAQCVVNSEYKGDAYDESIKGKIYWLRTPTYMTIGTSYWDYYVRIVADDGNVRDYTAESSNIGVRPAFYLADEVSFGSGIGTENKPYTISDSGNIPSPIPSPTAKPTPTPATKYFTVLGSRVTNTADTAQTATIITAQYSGNRLTDVKSQEVTFAGNETKAFTVPTGGKLFVWDSVSGMRSLTK